ncbi:MAG: oligopeptide transporter, OPT family, partial [Rhodanobacteraceae bacterium]
MPQTELSWRGILIGVLITLIFTAANVYFGLKAGLTFATSIPAAVISMAVLRKMRGATIQENNIVQTIASAAGTLSAIIFVLPGLVIVGWWASFPYWETMLICALGGTLGVMYSIPLRRALVTGSDLPYPEGVACAEVLKVGASHRDAVAEGSVEGGQAGFMAVLWGAIVSGAFAVIEATHIFGTNVEAYFRVGDRSATGFNFSLSLALLAVGHLVG